MFLSEVISHCCAGVGSNFVIVWFLTLADITFFAQNVIEYAPKA
jgi:hypothetical protein